MIDERQYIEAVLASGVFKAHYVHADQLNPLMDLGTILGHTDEAFVAPNLYLHWALYAAAQQQHCRVFLDGIDGDTTVSHGLGYFAELAGSGRWRRLMREAVALAVTMAVLANRTGKSDIGVRVPVANRRWTDTENLIGCFANIVVIRAHVSHGASPARFREVQVGVDS